MAGETKTEQEKREERLAAQLRANLKKRKAQVRGRAATVQDDEADEK